MMTLQTTTLRYFQNRFTALFLGEPVRSQDAAALLGLMGSEKAAASGFFQETGQKLLASPYSNIAVVLAAMNQYLENEKIQSLGRRALLTILADPDVLQAAYRRDLSVFRDGSISTESTLLREMGFKVLLGAHRTVIRGNFSHGPDPDDLIVTSLLHATFFHDRDCLSDMADEGQMLDLLYVDLPQNEVDHAARDDAFAIAVDVMLSTLLKTLQDQEHKRGIILWNKILDDEELNLTSKLPSRLFDRMLALDCFPAVYNYMLSHQQERSEDGGVPELCMEFFAWPAKLTYNMESPKYLIDLVLDTTLDWMLGYNDTSKQFFFHAVEMFGYMVPETFDHDLTEGQKTRVIAATEKAVQQFPVDPSPWDGSVVSVEWILESDWYQPPLRPPIHDDHP